MTKFVYIVSEHYPERSDDQVTQIPIAIFHGDSKEDYVKHIIRIIAKWLAKGDFTKIAEKEKLVYEDKENIEQLILEDLEGGMYFEDSLIYIEPLETNDEIDIKRHELRRRGRYVIYDKETCRYSDGIRIC